MRYLFISVLLYFFISSCAPAQGIETKRLLQFSLVPGLSTNGLQPGSFNNYFSVNLTSGYSASSSFFEIASISNLNTHLTKGLQLAGIANLTGVNAFAGLSKKEKENKIKTGYTSLFSGAQFSGLANVVMNDAYGAQVSGAFNVSKGALLGMQWSGIANVVYKYSFGFQLSGLSNVSYESMDGVQVAGLMNYTQGGLYGVQISAYNKAGFTEGINSYENKSAWGLQLGLINVAQTMNGFQIGLINWCKHSQGTQIGLINIYKGGKQTGSKDGTAIGLINIGDMGYLAVSANELFAVNYELATGNRKNARLNKSRLNKYWENALIYSRHSFNQSRWAFGYGIRKMYFNRSTLPGMTEFRFISWGMDFQHVNNKPGKIERDLSLLTRLKLMAGTRIAPKLLNVYVFTAITANGFLSDEDQNLAPNSVRKRTPVKGESLEWWPGFSAGILIH